MIEIEDNMQNAAGLRNTLARGWEVLRKRDLTLAAILFWPSVGKLLQATIVLTLGICYVILVPKTN